jgi:hypothetical protein
LELVWSGHITFEATRKTKISNYILEIKMTVKKAYAQAANTYQSEINTISLSFGKLDGELEAQLVTVDALMAKLAPYKTKLEDIQKLWVACIEANIEDNEFSIYNVEDLEFELDLLVKNLVKTRGFVENHIASRGMTNITPEQLESYGETFKFFDKDNTNSLDKREFKAALQAEGTAFTEEEVDKLFKNDMYKLSWFVSSY